MRPKYLTLSAFGPYAEKVEIDFDKLGSKGLYIITGPTGAGKTTVFDAISYALFNKSSSKNRDADSLRSMYADISTPTFVELTFSLADRDYTVRRNPTYFRRAKRGSGTTEEKANVELTLPSGVVLSKKDAEEKLDELLAITYEQFKKIVMIAQGEFRDVLQADTKERQQIFRHIFGTEIYNDFTKELSEARSRAHAECQALENRIGGILEGLSCEKGSPAEERAVEIRTGSIPYEEISEFIDTLISEDDVKYKQTKKLINDDTEKLNLLTAEKEQAKAIVEKAEKLERANKSSLEQQKQKELLNVKLTLAEAKTKEADKFKGDALLIEKDLPEYDRLALKTEQVAVLQDTLNKKKEQLDKCTNDITSFEKSLSEKKAELEKISDAGEKLIELNGLKEKTEEKIDSLSSLKTTAEKVDFAEKEYKKCLADFESAQNAYNKASEEAKELRRLFNCEQAGIMADTLTQGSPCPVCGSTHHPNKAVKSAHAPTEAQTEQAENKEKKMLDAYNKASTQSANAKTALSMTKTAFTEEFKKIFGTADTDNYAERIEREECNLNSQKKKILADIRTENARAERKKRLTAEIPVVDTNLSKLNTEKTVLISEVAQTETRLKETSGLRDEIAKKLSFADKATAEAEKKRLMREAEKIEKEKLSARELFDKCKENCDRLTGEIESVSAEIKGKAIPDLTQIENTIAELTDKKGAEEKLREKTSGRLTANKKIREQFIASKKELERSEDEYNMICDIYNTANGQLSGKQKIQLETFIQMRYFDIILSRANRYLMQMSSGQYMFERRKTSDNNKTQSGLDLNVIDSYNGSRRNVSSLSGGEAFFASLSLALGLSEEVKESAGGIHLDCMFVDEGFGSLDGETLTKSMDALKSISTDGMLIGIISHVEALEKEIDNKIVVTKTPEKGSSARVCV